MSGGGHGKDAGAFRKVVIVLLLVGGVILIHRFATRSSGFDPSAMLALGFVILASYAFGQLVERLGLPHITGYLIAGLALGPSAAHLLPEAYQIRPFDDGVLSSSVITQLKPLELLAVALIALTAGGELKIANLKKGFGAILAVLGGQIVMIVGLAIVFVIGLSGILPMVTLPGLGELDIGGAAALGAVLGSISIATSPAATIAVINDVKARGPTTSTLLATVVLKDVVVVVLFAVLSTLAAQMLGLGGSEEALGSYLLKHIGGALLIGAVMGFVMAGYLRYVKREVLLFVVGMVFTAGFVAAELDVESVVLFITAGFVTANFSSEGDHMLETVETLSLPVYVVFFTLAGAKLHLDELATVAGFAVALVALRMFGIWSGTAIGSRIGGASEGMRRHGWLGFVSQAGVAISLATIVGERMGEPGEALSTLIIAGIAINEIVGPVLLKVGLGRTGETEEARDKQTDEETPSESGAPAPEDDGTLAPWPTPDVGKAAWGDPLTTSSSELNTLIQDLSLDLSHVSRDVSEVPLERFRQNALGYIRELRREFLRHHRRITVQAMADQTELSAAEALRLEQAELAEKWRAAVLSRAARVGQHRAWEPTPILAAVESVAEGLPATFEAPYEDASFVTKSSDGPLRRVGRTWLRARRTTSNTFGDGMGPRTIEMRALARYHLWGHLPERLEPVAALYAQAEGHLVDRTRSIFEGLVIAYDELAEEVETKARAEAERKGGELPEELEGPPEREASSEVPLDERLQEVRARVDEELVLAVQEIDAIAQDLAHRTSVAIGACLRDLKMDLPIVGTPDLRMRSRAASSLYRRRDERLEWLERGSLAARETSSALYNRLALEMELHALEGRVKDALEAHATALGRNVKGRAHRQVMRVHKEILATEKALSEALSQTTDPQLLAERIRTLTEPVVRVAAEAARVGTTLRDQLTDEGTVTPVLDSLTRAAQNLTDRYRIPAGPLARGEHRLPPQVATVEVPFRDWVLARIETSVAPRLLASTREVAQKVEPLAQSLSELERRVAFNVELAVNELSLLDEQVTPESLRLIQDMIGGALERNRELFGNYADTSSQWGEDVRESVRAAVLDGLDELRGGLVDGEVGRMRSQMVRDVRGRRISRVLSELRTSVARSSRIVRRALAESLGEDRLDRARSLLGLPEPEIELSAAEGTFQPHEPLSSIPMVYRRLFSAQALEAGDILTGRDDALNRTLLLLEGESSSLTGKLRTVAVVGPDGVGKSAFVNALLRAKRWSKVRELKLESPASREQIDAVFDGGGEGQLVVVTGLKWMRAIRPGGFGVLRHFVTRVIADGGRNAFLVRADRLVWEQQREVAPLEDAFPEVIRLDPLEPQALQAAVLARHTVSGYGLVFSQGMTPESRLEELVLQGTTPISRPQESFFRALHAASGGLLRDALRLWLASVTEVDDKQDFVHLGPVPTPSIYALRKLSDMDVLTLYQVARQGWMDKRVCASLFRLDESAAEARLLSLSHVGILDQREGTYRIALHLRGSTRRLLRERGFVT